MPRHAQLPRCLLILVVAIMPAAALQAQQQDGPDEQTSQKVASLYRDSYVLESKGKYAGAAGKVQEVVKLSGASYYATVRLGWLTYLAGDFDASAAAYTQAVAMVPTVMEPKLGLTLPLLAARKWKELERACREVLALDAQNASGRARLAQALYGDANNGDAAATYQKLSAEYPSNLDYRTGLGWSLLRQGRTADARQVFQAVLALSPDNVSAKAGMAFK